MKTQDSGNDLEAMKVIRMRLLVMGDTEPQLAVSYIWVRLPVECLEYQSIHKIFDLQFVGVCPWINVLTS